MTSNLTNDMIRLSEEISALRHNRAALTCDLMLGRVSLGKTVSEMISGFQRDRQEMGEKTKVEVGEFVSKVKDAVAGLRAEFASDMKGAQKAWSGAERTPTPMDFENRGVPENQPFAENQSDSEDRSDFKNRDVPGNWSVTENLSVAENRNVPANRHVPANQSVHEKRSRQAHSKGKRKKR